MNDILESRSTTPTPTATSFRFRSPPSHNSDQSQVVPRDSTSDGNIQSLISVAHRALDNTPSTSRTVLPAHDDDRSPESPQRNPRRSSNTSSHSRSASGPPVSVSAMMENIHRGAATSLPPSNHNRNPSQKTIQEVTRLASPSEPPQPSNPKPVAAPLHNAIRSSLPVLSRPSQPDTLLDRDSSPSSPPLSPSRARSMNDLLAEVSKPGPEEMPALEFEKAPSDTTMANAAAPSPEAGRTTSQSTAMTAQSERKEPDLFRWSKVDDLIDKMLWLSVTGSDPAFIRHFLLMYRKFTTPRSVILCMQRRLRFLDNETKSDPLFSAFGQLKICRLLQSWMVTYPTDFAVPGADGALSAILKFIMNKPYLIHLSSVYVPFLDKTPQLIDPSAGWAKEAEIPGEDNEDRYTITDLDERSVVEQQPSTVEEARPSADLTESSQHSLTVSSRARTTSLPLSLITPPSTASRTSSESDSTAKLIRDLLRVSHHLDFCQVNDIAEELTAIELEMFLNIKPRDWLAHIFLSGKKNPETCPVAKMGSESNRLAEWVASIILCHEKPKTRAKQVARFVEIALKCRDLKNYSSVRSILAGIHASMIEGDTTNEHFARSTPTLFKKFLSLVTLLHQREAHRAYRMALKSTPGACIPAVIVHVSDLLRANDGNPDWHPQDPLLLHWAKFNMLGKFVDVLTDSQEACMTGDAYKLRRHGDIRSLIETKSVMDPEIQYSRLNLPADLPTDGSARSNLFNTYVSESTSRRESAFFRKLFSR